MKIKCLMLDHDDTVVRSGETVNYPSMQRVLDLLRPGRKITLRDFNRGCFAQNFEAYCHEAFGFNKEEIQIQFDMWKEYVRDHVPPAFDGMPELLRRFHEAGGIICVSSHSGIENITRDYDANIGLRPDRIYGWELGEKRKPHPFALQNAMEEFDLRPDEVLMVDDAKTGYDMARAAGVAFACAGWVYSDERIMEFMREHCDYYLPTVAELEKLIFDD